MPNNLEDMRKAWEALAQFRARATLPHHDRYSFPFLCGSYFAYRKVDARRVAAIANSVSSDPSYLDVGCGYGDFLRHVREFIPKAEGLEVDGSMFYSFGIAKPDYIRISDARWVDKKYDLIFVGWMEPGQDFRDSVAKGTDVIVTTLDQGISLAAEFDGHGFERVASWRTPSWEDVNTELMNKYYTSMPEKKRAELASMRGAHNLWYVYAKPAKREPVLAAMREYLESEGQEDQYDFESVLDECGFRYMERLSNPAVTDPLWMVKFN
jgi:SAM-dependent methyltransferase